jgi:hypothetical protein
MKERKNKIAHGAADRSSYETPVPNLSNFSQGDQVRQLSLKSSYVYASRAELFPI